MVLKKKFYGQFYFLLYLLVNDHFVLFTQILFRKIDGFLRPDFKVNNLSSLSQKINECAQTVYKVPIPNHQTGMQINFVSTRKQVRQMLHVVYLKERGKQTYLLSNNKIAEVSDENNTYYLIQILTIFQRKLFDFQRPFLYIIKVGKVLSF